MMTDSASSSSFSFGYGWTYDVFLSFRGKDTRLGFTGNLYKALCDKGIHTFIDDEQLQSGDQITPTLFKAIQESKIAILVLSENYASSSFCLDELVNILHCSNKKGALVLPIFYDVDPSDLRHLKGSYGEALAKHAERFKDIVENMERLENWKMALHQVANLSGWHFEHGNGYEYEFIGSIVEEVCNKINRHPLHVADHPVGLEFQVSQVNSLLYGGFDDGVRMVGIYGIGGIGKTTLARAVYNSIAYQFEGLCFLEDVRENSKNRHGLVHLQEALLSEIVREKDIKLRSVSQGIPIIKRRLRQKKVLLVLDDVDELEQLKAIAGGADWFGSGSKVIITTRDKHLLKSHGVERTYEAAELNEKDALELLSWNAFKTDKVDPSYLDLLSRAITYACGLTLAVEVIGSNLFGKTTEEWRSALDQYERIPDKRIQNILKISFDSLDEHQQNFFLDIACCFKGRGLANVKKILSAHHGVCPEYGIGVLFAKSLIKIDEYGRVTLHDLIEDMGKEIVRQESSEEPGKRSRLWFHEDIIQVLEGNMGTSRIQIINLDSLTCEVDWDGKAFKEMENLKTLIIRNVCFSKGPEHLPNSLRVLEWQGYPSTSLPSDFYPKKLVILDLPLSDRLMPLELSMSKKKLVNLTLLNFDECRSITELPDVSSVPNLENLSLRNCWNLIKIHESVGFLEKLKFLDAINCKGLRTFPPIKLTSLENFQLLGCSCLESFPEILGKMEAITSVFLKDTSIEELPASIQYLTKLESLGVSSCGMFYLPSTFTALNSLHLSDLWLQLPKEDNGEERVSSIYSSNLEAIFLTNCHISDDLLRKGLIWFANVKSLNIRDVNFTILPACIKEFRLLRSLNLDYCKLLRQIEGIPPNLKTFTARGCTSLNDLDLTLLPACTKECHFLKQLILDDCVNLQEIIGVPSNIEFLSAFNCKSLTSLCGSMLLNQELNERAGFMYVLPGTRIPEWFEHRSSGPSISLWCRNNFFPTISLCLEFGERNHDPSSSLVLELKLVISNYNRIKPKVYWPQDLAGNIFIFDKLQIDDVDDELLEKEWNHVEVSVSLSEHHLWSQWLDYIPEDKTEGYWWVPKEISPEEMFPIQIGLHVVKQESCMEDIRFTNPCKRGKLNDLTSE